jgi:hypothetical protein
VTTVLLVGRKLPHGDFEGDDWVPGSSGRWVTCTDSSLGRDVAYATNGRVNRDGQVYRAAIHPHDPDGITLRQAQQACMTVTGLPFVIPSHWHWAEVLAHLRARKGAVVQLWYSAIPREYRFQARADFGHAVFISHYSTTAGMRVWDALDANTKHHGQWVPARYIRAGMEELSRRNGTTALYIGYVPLQPL